MIVYHGSNNIIKLPKVQATGFYKDFGFAFYCTNIEKQAKRWALTKRPNHVVNVYDYQKDETLKVLTFDTMTEEWLDFVVNCRKGVTHKFDIVEGPMADDTIWDYIENFVANEISREAFWALVKFKYPTHQIAFCNDMAINTLTFKDNYLL